MTVRNTFAPKPKMIFGKTSKPYAHLKNVSERDFQPGDVTTIDASVPRTRALERTATRAFFRPRALRAMRRSNSTALGVQLPPKE